MYIDIHTHQFSEESVSIKNIDIQEYLDTTIPSGQYFSVGLHPWHATKNYHAQTENLKQALKNQNCLAIGEIGLDHTISVNKEFQLLALEVQLKLAMEYEKPIIFHCVKCYDELAAMLKKMHPEIPLILHAFNGNSQTASMFFPYNSYFSFGKYLLNTNTKAAKNFAFQPRDRIFFETDEFPIHIKEIYLQAEKISNISEHEWQRQILYNFNRVFNLHL